MGRGASPLSGLNENSVLLIPANAFVTVGGGRL